MWSFRKEIVTSDRQERKLNDIVALKYSPQQLVHRAADVEREIDA